MQSYAELSGLTVESEHPEGSIGYEYDCADAVAELYPEEERAALHAIVQGARDRLHANAVRGIARLLAS
jgi:hypothetical protein